LVGEANYAGRNNVSVRYTESILPYNIVVVAQKDLYEEHFRLMEALVSGALVMSDIMMSIPPDFVDGESIVFNTDTTVDLPNKIRYQ